MVWFSSRFYWCLLLLFCLRPASAQVDLYDIFYDDNTTRTLNRLTPNIPQEHTIHDASDVDWAVFYAREGLPYTIRVTEVGQGLDPELWIDPNVTGLPMPIDMEGSGADEFYTRQSWPLTGWCWFGVSPAAMTEGPTSYTLVVYQNTGANLGLATISGTKARPAQSDEDSLSFPPTIQVGDELITPVYTRSTLSYPAATFPDPDRTHITFGGLGGNINALNKEWVIQWHALHPNNFTIVTLSFVTPTGPAKPIDLSIQMIADRIAMDLWDDPYLWEDIAIQDVQPDDPDESVSIYRWDASEKRWSVHDISPQIEKMPLYWLAKTTIEPNDVSINKWEFFAAAVENLENCSNVWTLYD